MKKKRKEKKEKEHKRCTSQENQRSAVNSLNAGKRK